MACCAFAVFVLSQLLAPFVWLRRRLFGATTTANAAVAWSPGVATIASPRSSRWLHKTFFAAVAVELVIGAATLVYSAPRVDTDTWVEATAFDGAWCRALVARIEGRN